VSETPARPPPPLAPTVTYYAISILNSRTFRINAALIVVALVPLLAEPDLVALIPARYLVLYGIAIKVVNIVLRYVTVRPVAIIPPGDTVPMAVPKLDPPTTAAD